MNLQTNTTAQKPDLVNSELTMAASRVFGIPELVEMILEELPFKDVLRMIRVKTAFRDTLKLSPRLQRQLFLQQSPSTSACQSNLSSIRFLRHVQLHHKEVCRAPIHPDLTGSCAA